MLSVRRASANRVLTMLKAALNHAYDEGHVANRDAWGRKLKPFRGRSQRFIIGLKTPTRLHDEAFYYL